MRGLGLVLVLWLAITAAPHAENWPAFRGLHASGTADGENPPTAWEVSSRRNIAWSVAIPGLAHSSPIVWGDRVFVTTAVSTGAEAVFRPGFSTDGHSATDGTIHSWRVYSLDRQTGRIVWEREARRGPPRSKRHPKSSHASSTPVTDGRHVVAFFGSEGLYCYDLEGRLLWTRDLGVLDAGSTYYPERQWGTASSPIIVDGRILVQADLQSGSFLAAFDVATGEPVWRTSRDEIPSWASPGFVPGSRPQVVTNGARFIRGYDVRSGRELWRSPNASDIAVPTPVAADGLIFVTSGYGPEKPIIAIRTDATGEISASENGGSSAVAWALPRGGSYISTPLVYRGHLYTLASTGVLACYEVETGRRLYERRIGGAGGAYSASPIAADGRIYVSSEDGNVYVLKAGPEYQELGANSMDAPVMATPAISGGMLFIRTTRHLFAVGRSSGRAHGVDAPPRLTGAHRTMCSPECYRSHHAEPAGQAPGSRDRRVLPLEAEGAVHAFTAIARTEQPAAVSGAGPMFSREATLP